MILFVELCVDLKKGKLAKDGLYQYKNTAQNSNVGTIEVGGQPCLDGLANNSISWC
jgi:translation initiation factor 3 subunit A